MQAMPQLAAGIDNVANSASIKSDEEADASGGYHSPSSSIWPSDNDSEWDRRTFVTATTARTQRTFHSALSGRNRTDQPHPNTLQATDKYAVLLQSQGLWPVDLAVEQDWSGRGQHAKFRKDERMLINRLLVVQETLGTTGTAKVESVKCRRILLARKSLTCRRSDAKKQVLQEVAHLHRLKHAHIVRVIGTYVLGAELSILLFPVAEYNLKTFLSLLRPSRTVSAAQSSCIRFFSCLSAGLAFIHASLTKHMDIKPPNILVKKVSTTNWDLGGYTVLIADFGIARSYDSPQAAETDGQTSFTPKYAAPEVAEQDTRGFSADIFSLGCVFLEMHVRLWDSASNNRTHSHGVLEILESNPGGDRSYQANLTPLMSYLTATEVLKQEAVPATPTPTRFRLRQSLIFRMMQHNSSQRPTAAELNKSLGQHPCCGKGTSQLEVATEDPEASLSESSTSEDTSDNEESNLGGRKWLEIAHDRSTALDFVLTQWTRSIDALKGKSDADADAVQGV